MFHNAQYQHMMHKPMQELKSFLNTPSKSV